MVFEYIYISLRNAGAPREKSDFTLAAQKENVSHVAQLGPTIT